MSADTKNYMQKRYIFNIITIAAILALTAILYLKFFKSNIKNATFPEQVVFAMSSDDSMLEKCLVLKRK
jgi:hypothetical protein